MRECGDCGCDLTEYETDFCDKCEREYSATQIDEIQRAKEVMQWEQQLQTEAQIDLYLVEPQGSA